ncbi:MAG: class I SAM-dependent methyltransferase [Acidobacteriota bacterium]|nr:class I SAM-dependent methyltransferase [Acidobacteriota bacterium]
MTVNETVNEAERRRWNDEHWTSAWPKRETMTSHVTPYLIDAARPEPGHRVLDIGSGAGIAALQAAAAVGPTGAVVGADISAPLVDYARRRAAAEAATTVRFVVRDVQQEPIDDQPFDVAISQFGVMFFEDPVEAFANIRSHVVPGGRLAFACWQSVDRNPWFIGRAVAAFTAPPPAPAPGKSPTGPFAFADADAVLSVLSDAGWSDPRSQPHQVEALIAEEAIVDDGQLRFLGIPDEHLDAARAAVDRHLDPLLRDGDLIAAPLAFHIFTATA